MITEILTSIVLTVVPTPKTNGAINPAVTQATISKTICVVGWTSTVRPPYSYTEPIKIAQIKQYGYKDTAVYHYEEDHIIPLELGGSPKSKDNLWPEPHPQSFVSDGMENKLRSRVCLHIITLSIARNDIVAYKKLHG